MLIANHSQEQDARAYCHGLGLDPDEVVGGYDHRSFQKGQFVRQARWVWYVGVSEAALRRPI